MVADSARWTHTVGETEKNRPDRQGVSQTDKTDPVVQIHAVELTDKFVNRLGV